MNNCYFLLGLNTDSISTQSSLMIENMGSGLNHIMGGLRKFSNQITSFKTNKLFIL